MTYYNEDPETPEPAVYEEPEEEDGLDILNTPFTLLLDTDALPDSLKANLPPGGSLPTLPQNPTIEQLKDAIKARKTTCAAVIAGYKCGNHDAASPPSGDDYQPQPGDELAMNSIKIEIVEIDAAGNGLGIAHIKGFNNAKLGVELKGIKVKEGGCIYAGQAITNSVDLALLNQKQRAALAQAYAAYNKALDKIEENAEGVAETYNSFSDLINGVKNASKAVISNLGENKKPTKSEIKKLELTTKKTTEVIDKMLKRFDKYYPNPTDPQIIAQRAEMVANANLLKKCNECSESFLKDTSPASAPTTPKSGPFFDENNSFGLLINNACTDSLTKLASKPFQEFVVKLNLLEKIPTKVQEALYKIKTEVAAKKPTVDLSEIFKSDYPNNFDISNVTVLLNGKQVKLSSFNLGKNGDYVLDIKDWSTETQAKDKILFAGATTSTDKILAIEASSSAISDVKSYLKLVKELTGKQLKEIFPGTSQARCNEVAELINKYAEEYGLTSNERLAHFIGQIGAETQLKKLSEESYSATRILTADKTRTLRTHNGKKVLKYCSLYEGYSANGSGCPYPYCDKDIVVPEDSYTEIDGVYYAKENFMKNASLTVKSIITDEEPTDPDFFNIVYACQLNNGGIESGDGYRFRGRGFLQITGQTNYQTMVQTKWDAVHGKGTKDFMCRSNECDKNLDAIADDLDFSMQISLTFWKNGKTNDLANEVNKASIKSVTRAVNGQIIGIDNRTKYTNKAYEILKK